MSPLQTIASKIIHEQELVIGPLAWSEAKKVQGLSVLNQETSEISITGDSKEVIDRLVAQYERLFGRTSHEVCRSAAASIVATMPPAEVPMSLR